MSDKQLKQVVRTQLTDLFRIRHPILLAGMLNVASAPLAAAVSNAGGLGNIGGFLMKPHQLRKEVSKLQRMLDDKTCFGIDLLLPQVGGSARKTNTDYTKGILSELIDIVIESKARLFTAAVGVPPRWVVEKLHAAGVLVMNMVGAPHHVDKALAVGVDIICCQGYEAGGHTGDVGTMALLPMCLEKCKGKKSELHGGPIHIVGAGGIYNGRGMAAALSLGAEAVWLGTRFVASEEATTSARHKQAVVDADATSTTRSVIYTGRPARVLKTPYVMEWAAKDALVKELTAQGKIPYQWEMKQASDNKQPFSLAKTFPFSLGQGAGGITSVQPARVIINQMVTETATILTERSTLLAKL
eukprot:TRINITY_DN2847_c0_g3_i2.p1 TRINITY_DN2847_c0_g3~~TRINITY_DN2847_c0_g3_i2.p1  ORF type:complete len:357 (+),score=100.08 TRINITY_DN2847_c0_g3_i2:122-1192(+)